MEKAVVEPGDGGQYVFDIRLRHQPFLRHIQIHRQLPPHSLHNRHTLLLAKPTPLQIPHERKRIEMVHVGWRLQMRRFMLFLLLGLRGAHLQDRFERLGGAGFVIADGVGRRLFGVGLRGLELGGTGGGVAHRGSDGGVTGAVWFVLVLGV